MLVLSRKPGERILIGNDIVVTVVRFQGGTVRLGIEAPREFAVVREELLGEGNGELPAVGAEVNHSQTGHAQTGHSQTIDFAPNSLANHQGGSEGDNMG